jgi:co-chaperonin GroES (HSP10)
VFRPLSDYILVRPIPRKQSDLLWVAPEKFNRGVVLACGPGERLKKKNGEETGAIRQMEVKPGDFITYGDLDWIFPKFDEGGVEYRILQEKDVTFISEQPFEQAA